MSAGATVPPRCFHLPPSPQTRCRDKSSSGWQKSPFPSQGFIAPANCSQLSAPSPRLHVCKGSGCRPGGEPPSPALWAQGHGPATNRAFRVAPPLSGTALRGPRPSQAPSPPSGAPTPLCSMTREQPADLTLLQAHSLEGSLRSHSKGRQRHFLPTECHRTWTRCKPGCNLRRNRLKQ